jgi:hypothetical protein
MTAEPPIITAWRRGHVFFAGDEAVPNLTPFGCASNDAVPAERIPVW